MGYSSESEEMVTIDTDIRLVAQINCKNPNNFKCTYEGCFASFNRQWKLNGHIYGHKNERPYICLNDGCSKAYRTNSHLQRHIKSSHKSRSDFLRAYIYCEFPGCKRYFANSRNLRKHNKRHLNEDLYECIECKLKFKKHFQLKKHNYIHTGKYPYNCETCTAGFVRKRDWDKHKKKHENYKCEFSNCNSILETWTLLRKHMKLEHPLVYNCDKCMKKFHNKKFFEEHVLSHFSLNERNLIPCPYPHCQREYVYKRNLNHHMWTYHEGVRYSCSLCGKCLSTKAKLIKHALIHDPERNMRNCKKMQINQRKDKGKPQRSIAARLSGITLPGKLDRHLAQDNLTSVMEKEIEQKLNCLKYIDSENISCNMEISTKDVSSLESSKKIVEKNSIENVKMENDNLNNILFLIQPVQIKYTKAAD